RTGTGEGSSCCLSYVPGTEGFRRGSGRIRPEMTPSVSRRGRAMPASPIRRLMPVADEAERRGVHVYHLNIGQPDLETPAAMRDRLRLLEKEKVYAYTPSG